MNTEDERMMDGCYGIYLIEQIGESRLHDSLDRILSELGMSYRQMMVNLLGSDLVDKNRLTEILGRLAGEEGEERA